MNTASYLRRNLVVVTLLLGLTNSINAQHGIGITADQELYKEITRMDSILFDAYNTRNLEKLKTMFSEDLEFYHDIDGLTGYQKNMEAFKNNFEKNSPVRRELINGSTEVYALKNYGAIQVGQHRFCRKADVNNDNCGVFKFVHIWQQKDGQWKITRVISYGH